MPERKKVREARKAAGWTQAEMATHLGVSARTVRYWESGLRRPPPYLLGAINYYSKEGWINAKERQPDNQKEVLVCSPHLPVTLGYWRESDKKWFAIYLFEWEEEEVFWWRERPPLPTDAESAIHY